MRAYLATCVFLAVVYRGIADNHRQSPFDSVQHDHSSNKFRKPSRPSADETSFDDEFQNLRTKHRTVDPHNSYDPTHLVIYEFRKNEKVVLGLSAKLTPHFLNKKRIRINFPQSLKDRVKHKLNALRVDEPGYLVPPQFSGQPAWYNVIPLHESVVGSHDSWAAAEDKVAQALAQGNHVEWRVMLKYDTPYRPLRPTKMEVQYKVYNPADGEELDEDEGYRLNPETRKKPEEDDDE